MPARTIIVLGGAQSGPTAAIAARETDAKARIILVERAERVAYSVAAVPGRVSGEAAAEPGDAAGRLAREYEIGILTGVSVDLIRPRMRTILTSRGPLHYDSLVYALGAEPVRVAALAGAENVYGVRTPADWRGLEPALRGAREVAVVGGGFFGVEAADALLRRGCGVTLIERGARLLPAFSARAAEAVRAGLETEGARVITGARVGPAEVRRGRVVALRLSGGRRVRADVVIVAAGVRPRSELLGRAGARLHKDGSIAVGADCRTSLPGVYACGVCVSVPHAVTGARFMMAQAAIADKTARIAGAAAAGGKARLGAVLGTAIVRAGATVAARTGDSSGRLRVVCDGVSCEPYMSGAREVSVELCFDQRGRVLGAEVIGGAGVDKRIDVIAAAIAGGMTVERLAGIDLAYAPAFGTPCDAVNAAAAAAARALARKGR